MLQVCRVFFMLTWTTAGESHGPALIAVMEGMPAGVPLTTEYVAGELARRRLGYGRGARQKFEKDHIRILAGVRHGVTTGAPIAIEIGNSEWPKWETVMSADPVPDAALEVYAGRGDHREMGRNRPLTSPRPGHADLAGMLSYGHRDARNVLERASARETAARVALGACAKAYLEAVSRVQIVSAVASVGAVEPEGVPLATPDQKAALDASPVRSVDVTIEQRFTEAIDQARKSGDTIGGSVEVVAWNVPVGLGTHVNERDRLDARLAGALMSIQSAKAVEIGDGFAQARAFGSDAHDEMTWDEDGSLARLSNRAGGIEGGTSNGQPIVARVGFKPISTVPSGLRSVDLEDRVEAPPFHQRSDTCQVVPGAVIAEAVVALQLAKALDERLGGNSVTEARAHLAWYRQEIAGRLGIDQEQLQW